MWAICKPMRQKSRPREMAGGHFVGNLPSKGSRKCSAVGRFVGDLPQKVPGSAAFWGTLWAICRRKRQKSRPRYWARGHFVCNLPPKGSRKCSAVGHSVWAICHQIWTKEPVKRGVLTRNVKNVLQPIPTSATAGGAAPLSEQSVTKWGQK